MIVKAFQCRIARPEILVSHAKLVRDDVAERSQSVHCALGRRCRYVTNPTFAPVDNTEPGQTDFQNSALNTFPVTYFLDCHLFKHCEFSIRAPQVSSLWDHIESIKVVRQIVDRFFETIHLWLPILSRRKIYGHVLHQRNWQEDDMILLILSMRILANESQEGPPRHDRTYSMLKHQIVSLEQLGFLSIVILQSMILISVYELGHGIYPAAYLTVGSCARYAVALGLDKDILAWDHSDPGWSAMEEKHRAWWAIVIIERHMNINNPHRTLSTPDPNEKHFLPISDEDWNNGAPKGVSYTVSTPANEHMGKFARLAQATHLLSRVFRHVCDTETTPTFLNQEKLLIDRALRSLLSMTVAEEELCGLAYCSPVALLSSALLLLHSRNSPHYPQSGNDFDQGWLAAIEASSKVIMPIAIRLKDPLLSMSRNTSPLVLDWMYRSVVAHGIVPKTSSAINNLCVETLKGAIKELSCQWPVGVSYLELLDMRCLTNANAATCI